MKQRGAYFAGIMYDLFGLGSYDLLKDHIMAPPPSRPHAAIDGRPFHIPRRTPGPTVTHPLPAIASVIGRRKSMGEIGRLKN